MRAAEEMITMMVHIFRWRFERIMGLGDLYFDMRFVTVQDVMLKWE